HAQSDRWMTPYVKWRQLAASRGLAVDTWDLYPLESADVVFFLDLPTQRAEFEQARRQAPKAKFVLMLVESPLGRPYYFNVKNHEPFDLVLTFNWRLCDERRYFRYYLSIGGVGNVSSHTFDERRPLIMMNTNRLLGPFGLFANRQPGLRGIPGIGSLFS